jgi:hypothetical protein
MIPKLRPHSFCASGSFDVSEALTRPLDYSLNNPDTLTKYKTAGQIAQKVLQAVTGVDLLL